MGSNYNNNNNNNYDRGNNYNVNYNRGNYNPGNYGNYRGAGFPNGQSGNVGTGKKKSHTLGLILAVSAVLIFFALAVFVVIRLKSSRSLPAAPAEAAAPAASSEREKEHRHEWGGWITVRSAKCEEPGVEKRTCITDASHVEERSVPALGHDWMEATTERPQTCSRCGAQRGSALETPQPTAKEELTAKVGTGQTASRVKLYPASAEASSYINSNHIGERGVIVRYASCAIDGDPESSWQEAATGYGLNQWITVYFSRAESIRYLSFQLGNWYSSTAYKENGRPSELRLDFSDGSSVTCLFTDSKSEFEVALSRAVTADWVKITILGAYPGSKFEDTCISEIGFYS